ncbi:MAG: hypothetical protein P8M12_03650 [Flavobacteriales bacterium]|nr:hypothetical protein [Flavobacteriales bacterium]
MKTLKVFILLITVSSCASNVNDVQGTSNVVIETDSQTDSFIEHYNNGNVKVLGSFLKNKREGMWISYFENGTKQSVHHYKNGFLNGSIEVFLISGKLLYQGFYVEGEKHGKWIYYNKEQEPINTLWYQNGIQK